MSARRQQRRGVSWGVTLFLLTMIAAILWWRGHDYYPLSLDDRVEHPEFRTLRSSGNVGYGYGVAGTLLIFANLLYLARRRFARRNLGSMKTWLDLHVFTGLAGALFVVFHSTFQARSTISKATVLSLAVVILTGLVGRFLYALVPRSGDAQLKKAIADAEELVPGLGAQLQSVLDHHKPAQGRGGSLIGALLKLSSWRRTATDRREAIDVLIANVEHTPNSPPRSDLERVARTLQREARRGVRSVSAAALLRSWRNLHRFFAILMLLTVVFHIGVAWYYGYRWIWSE